MDKIIISIMNGLVVDVENPPEGWTYEVEDLNKDEEDDEPSDYKPKKTSSPSTKPMTYMQQFEAELLDKLGELADFNRLDGDSLDTFVKWAKDRHLSSYKNGVAVGKKEAKQPAKKFRK